VSWLLMVHGSVDQPIRQYLPNGTREIQRERSARIPCCDQLHQDPECAAHVSSVGIAHGACRVMAQDEPLGSVPAPKSGTSNLRAGAGGGWWGGATDRSGWPTAPPGGTG
jgi:hypothetical protein